MRKSMRLSKNPPHSFHSNSLDDDIVTNLLRNYKHNHGNKPSQEKQSSEKRFYSLIRISLFAFLGLQAFYVIEQNNTIQSITQVSQATETQMATSQNRFYQALKNKDPIAMEKAFNVLLHTPETHAKLMATWLFLEIKNSSLLPLAQRQRMAYNLLMKNHFLTHSNTVDGINQMSATLKTDVDEQAMDLLKECKPLDIACSLIGQDYVRRLDMMNDELKHTQAQALTQVQSWLVSHQNIKTNMPSMS